ncbi:hypothetical protein LMG27952_06670 [Paraburkholderia hiiakae]|uniref:Uncharacterized protein n=1 Tax=Paraburkholderia hiiakae TaxID=1081782 RepID=A0ABN7IFY1_9BURK|nr:hypothetical protein [Paraburkholderia hiiakae]CAD6558665.1 hypothetical protein LMG27952_06670 [Paraburkholderia hiiakae]
MLFIVQWSGPAIVRKAAVERFKRHVDRSDQFGMLSIVGDVTGDQGSEPVGE